ncbi:hypothetical protein [Ferrimonas marina]|uniref:Uncharacterized protein n=1 Tax=Ferrimonas marina TaxID=299255 RepID=A0A1M5TQQ1_9GAMM|nr:hypothetical protein [Ferrimonas marina]SHH53008.1 hypothetical protein SAMN02745129_2239 [Ferrimonas marina]
MTNRSNNDRSNHFNPTWEHYRSADYNNPDHELYSDEEEEATTAAPQPASIAASRAAYRQAEQQKEQHRRLNFDLEPVPQYAITRVTVFQDGEPRFCFVLNGTAEQAERSLLSGYPGAGITLVFPAVQIIGPRNTALGDMMRELTRQEDS